jgi:vacuolar protein sorting-associated protein 13A/C
LQIQHGTRALSLDVKADGTTQLLTISNYREDQSIYKLKRRDTMSSIRDTVSSSRDSVTALSEFEAVEQDFGPTLIVKIEFEGIGISMMNRKLIEVVYFTFGELKIEYTNSPSAQAVTVSCGILQVDNQLQDAYFPVLLQPSPIGRDARNLGALPTLQASVTILNDNGECEIV